MAIGAVPKTFNVNVAVAGTRVPLSATKLLVKEVVIQARPTNLGNIYFGGDDVSSANGVVMPMGKSFTITDMMVSTQEELIDLANVYIDADNAGEGVRVLYMLRS